VVGKVYWSRPGKGRGERAGQVELRKRQCTHLLGVQERSGDCGRCCTGKQPWYHGTYVVYVYYNVITTF
jgi:hypothetical protein